uniref:AlNc14C264G9861 protein n=1 Tax=Albugo laibachii Nc14 TaxID=890382 RepID=F0WU38_9STRA|nr:AlNc14C264G9861 [Albugo laibachii Nc14]|eukprot:CCA24883.1 AlNc14C264G9861 [Albugo laibachii Nc14]
MWCIACSFDPRQETNACKDESRVCVPISLSCATWKMDGAFLNPISNSSTRAFYHAFTWIYLKPDNV